jgi:hypothetical protein
MSDVMSKGTPDKLDYAEPPRRRGRDWHSLFMFAAIVLVIVTFIAAMWAVAATFRMLPM